MALIALVHDDDDDDDDDDDVEPLEDEYHIVVLPETSQDNTNTNSRFLIDEPTVESDDSLPSSTFLQSVSLFGMNHDEHTERGVLESIRLRLLVSVMSFVVVLWMVSLGWYASQKGNTHRLMVEFHKKEAYIEQLQAKIDNLERELQTTRTERDRVWNMTHPASDSDPITLWDSCWIKAELGDCSKNVFDKYFLESSSKNYPPTVRDTAGTNGQEKYTTSERLRHGMAGSLYRHTSTLHEKAQAIKEHLWTTVHEYTHLGADWDQIRREVLNVPTVMVKTSAVVLAVVTGSILAHALWQPSQEERTSGTETFSYFSM